MKLRRKNLTKNYYSYLKKLSIRTENNLTKKFKKKFSVKSNLTKKNSLVNHVCKVTGANFAVNRKSNLNRHFVRLFDNKKYLSL